LRGSDDDLLAHMIERYLKGSEGKPDRLLLYVDQWEELYTQAPSGNDREHASDIHRFIDLLLTASHTAPVVVVGTVRADFYDPLIGHEQIKSLLPSCQVLLGKMQRTDLEQAIVEPAKKVALEFDPPKLVQTILDEAGEDEGMLPLLQYALKETWNQREGNRLTAGSYARSGGVREAIRIIADRTFDAFPSDDQQAARKLFLRLVTPGEGQEDTRARASMPTEADQLKIIEQFSDQRTRLLVTGLDQAKHPIVEVAHEALIRSGSKNGSMRTGRSCGRAQPSYKPRPIGKDPGEPPICFCILVYNSQGRGRCWRSRAISRSTMSEALLKPRRIANRRESPRKSGPKGDSRRRSSKVRGSHAKLPKRTVSWRPNERRRPNGGFVPHAASVSAPLRPRL
jgi:hypothetical protein